MANTYIRFHRNFYTVKLLIIIITILKISCAYAELTMTYQLSGDALCPDTPNCYLPNSTLSLLLNISGTTESPITAIGLEGTIPANWGFIDIVGTPTSPANTKYQYNKETNLNILESFWIQPPSLPLQLTIRFNSPSEYIPNQCFTFRLIYRTNSNSSDTLLNTFCLNTSNNEGTITEGEGLAEGTLTEGQTNEGANEGTPIEGEGTTEGIITEGQINEGEGTTEGSTTEGQTNEGEATTEGSTTEGQTNEGEGTTEGSTTEGQTNEGEGTTEGSTTEGQTNEGEGTIEGTPQEGQTQEGEATIEGTPQEGQLNNCFITNDLIISQSISGEGLSTINNTLYYIPGKSITVTVSFIKNTSDSISALGLTSLFPQGCQFKGVSSSTNAPAVYPTSNKATSNGVDPFEFAWINSPPFPFNFSFNVYIPSNLQGPQQIITQSLYRTADPQLCSNIVTTTFAGNASLQEGEGTIEGSTTEGHINEGIVEGISNEGEGTTEGTPTEGHSDDCPITNDLIISQELTGEGISTTENGMNYIPGKSITVTISFVKNTSENILALGLISLFPQGCQFQGVSSTNAPAVYPSSNKATSNGIDPFEFAWINIPSFPFNFSFNVYIPSNLQGPQQIVTQSIYRMAGPQLCSNIVNSTFVSNISLPEGEGEGEGEGKIEGNIEGTNEGEKSACFNQNRIRGCQCKQENTQKVLKNLFGDIIFMILAISILGLTIKTKTNI